ncbi:MAG: response regulator transcription factor [Actinomycetota bacterium]
MRVLVVEDDPATRSSLERSLTFEGYTVVAVPDGDACLAAIDTYRPQAIILDLGLPKVDGLEVCRRLRAAGDDVPVLMLTARESTGARVRGLDAGADDYLPKPFELEELLARLRALLRRSGATATAQQVLVVDDLRVDLASREVTRGGQLIDLTRTEFELLRFLASSPRQVFTRAQILSEVWGYEFDPTSNTLEVYVGYLRRKTELDGKPRLVHTVRGVGYVVRPSQGSSQS